MNPLLEMLVLKKEMIFAQLFVFFLSLFLVYGIKMSTILVMHIFHSLPIVTKSLGFKLNDHLKSMFGTKYTST